MKHLSVCCDNKSSLLVFDPWFIPDPGKSSFDLTNSIWHLIKASPLRWTSEHVFGHQDKTGHHLDRFASLNCDMDALANTYRDNIMAQQPPPLTPHFHLHSEGWSIWHGTEKIASPGRTQLYEIIYAPIIQRYWTKSHHLSPQPRFLPTTAALIDWTATDDLMKSLSPSKQRWCTKHGSENCGVGITLMHWKKQLDNECPRCQAPEDTTHVLRCTAHNSSETWDSNLTSLIETLANFNTPLPLHQAIISRLQGWRMNLPNTDDPTWSPSLQSLIQAQDIIGWKNFMEGLPSLLWIPYMAKHYSDEDSTLCPKDWLRKTLKGAHHLAWSQWEHRNKILHDDDKPRARRAIQLLHRAIMMELYQGTQDLPVQDHHHFRHCLADLLLNTTVYKQQWYLHVIAARARNDRRAIAAGSLRPVTEADPRLDHWIHTNRLQ